MSGLYFIILLVMAAVVVVLAIGIGQFGRGGLKAGQRSNKMMQARLILQGLAVVLILLFVFLGGRDVVN